MSDVKVLVDERVRLVTAVLAGSRWPEEEQATLAHAVHPHAKQLRQWVLAMKDHPAVVQLNEWLAAGIDVSVVVTAVLHCRGAALEPVGELPVPVTAEWLQAVADFARQARLAEFWADPVQQAHWQTAMKDLEAIFRDSYLPELLTRLIRKPVPDVVVMPNLAYPALIPVLARGETAIYLLLPPPKAVGESPPWPYAEDPNWVLVNCMRELVNYLLARQLVHLSGEQRESLIHAAAALLLEMDMDELEAQSYLVRIRREHRLPDLPEVVERLRAFVTEGNGRSLAEIL
ncbi:MAG: hypothetical protein D6706_19185 [Chloroflexi bacterium]|nr:MAG: hypothetical protein D6706_19185 [Chloroflexota bacterium]